MRAAGGGQAELLSLPVCDRGAVTVGRCSVPEVHIEENVVGTLQNRAQALSAEAFTGGPADQFEQIGRMQLVTLIEEGLEPQHRVLDIGCGALRAGYWLMHFLNPSCYYGIEPNERMLKAGITHILDDGQLEVAAPTFDHNDRFDLGVYGVDFDVVLARSIWTHASKPQIQTMLDGFAANSTTTAFSSPPTSLRAAAGCVVAGGTTPVIGGSARATRATSRGWSRTTRTGSLCSADPADCSPASLAGGRRTGSGGCGSTGGPSNPGDRQPTEA